jgi:anaerobic sulfite reductase subunit B
MVSDYTEYKIIDVRKDGVSSNIIRIKHKPQVFPGQFFIAGMLGFGEVTLPIFFSDGENLEFIVSGMSEASKKMLELKKKDLIFLRGPYGHGFPMNNLKHKEIFIIGESALFAPLFAAVSYMEQNKKEYEKIKIMLLLKNETSEFSDAFKKFDGKNEIEFIKAKSIDIIKELVINDENAKRAEFLLSFENRELKDILSFLKEKGFFERQIYFYLNRKISCGTGICGACAVFGVHACIDGPVIRADQISRFFR